MKSNDTLTNAIQTLAPEEVAREQATDEGGMYPESRMMSAISPVVVRQDSAEGPAYQEALGYTFLINDPRFPGLVRMDSGRLVLTFSAVPGVRFEEPGTRKGLIIFSEDEGMSWSQPSWIPMQRCTPVNLGGNRLMLRGYLGGCDEDVCPHVLVISGDGGQTWSEPEPMPTLADGRECWTDVALNPLVEGNTVTFVFYATRHDAAEDEWKGVTLLRRYDVDKHTWSDPSFLPETFQSSEGAITRARNGDLVVAMRTRCPGMPAVSSDHWRGISTSRSSDNGKTWSEPDVHLFYGHVHESLLRLSDERILMTYAARIGELEGRTYHGIEAVMSHDDGATWDWDHRYILFRWPNRSMHSPQSALLSDGRILTVLLHHTSFTWSEGERTPSSILNSLGNVSVVIWSPKE